MASIHVPQSRSTFVLEHDWQVQLDWHSSNLVILREFNLTGQKKISQGSYYQRNSQGELVRDSQGKFLYEEHFRNVTVPNPLFRDDEGEFTPVMITIPAGTSVFLTKYHTGQMGWINGVSLKITDCPGKPKIKNKCLLVDLDQFNLICVR